jgi:hypothetical protein
VRPKGGAAVLEARRRRALGWLKKGLSLNEVARRVGCAPSSSSGTASRSTVALSSAPCSTASRGCGSSPSPPTLPSSIPMSNVWQLAKAVLANGRPDDLRTLTRDVRTTLRRLSTSQRHLRACITHALPIRLPGSLRYVCSGL